MVPICLSCGCVLAGTGTPDDDHGDPANITLTELAAAATASGIATGQAAENVLSTIRMAANAPAPDPLEVAKAAGEPQRYVLGVAYQAGPDSRIAKGVDGGRDFFTEAELELAAWRFLQNGPRVGMFHLPGTDEDGGQATVVESYIYRGPDWDLGEGIVVKSGDWLLGAILNERAWELHKAGKLNGWSPQGVARRRRVRKAAEPVTATFTVAGPPDQVAAFAQLCGTIQWLCSAGASRTVQIDVDGDGAGALRFDLGDLEPPRVDESQMDSSVVRVPGIGD